jgi:hypothetical protein
MPDFIVADHGSIVTMTPMTPAAKAWVEEWLPEVQWFGRSACIERRYWPDIYQGITEEAGLTVA